MKITVAICTWNRAKLLDQTLARLAEVAQPSRSKLEWELLVVNNNCTDDTDAVLARYADRLPLRRLFESVPGQSSARNCAIDAATGELIVWTDDDVLVGPNWLEAYAAAAQRWPEAAFFGGPIHPWFAVPPPSWLLNQWELVSSVYAVRDFGKEPIPLSRHELPFGANFATRTDVQRRFRFDPALGLRPGSDMRCEEVMVLDAMVAAGHAGRWVPDAPVEHYIPAARLTTNYVRRYYEGYGQFLERRSPDQSSTRLLGCPRWMWRRCLALECRYRLSRMSRPVATWLPRLIDASLMWGRLSIYRMTDAPLQEVQPAC